MKCEPWEFELEYEMERATEEDEEALRNVCPICGSIVYGNYCRLCKKPVPTEKYYDPDFDEYLERVEESNKEYFESFKNKDQWEEVM